VEEERRVFHVAVTRAKDDGTADSIGDNYGASTSATVYNDDPDASLISTWTQWRIDLKEVGDAGVVLTDVSNLAIGFGGADDLQPGGSGLMFFDDIRLYRPAP